MLAVGFVVARQASATPVSEAIAIQDEILLSLFINLPARKTATILAWSLG
ncbi:MAG TPA: hypothetical protein V6D16_16865 [Candidatus Obscuribacterales bacterium]